MTDDTQVLLEWPWPWTSELTEGRRAFVLEHLGPSLAGVGIKPEEFVAFVSAAEKWLESGEVDFLKASNESKLTLIKREK